MQEISEHVFIEHTYPGVVLGAINWPHGLILIDAPFRPDDVRSWRSALLNLGGGVDRMLINLDVHADRTLGARLMECTVVGHEMMSKVFRNRPITFKAQGSETGAEWETYNGLGSVRWAPPEITFTSTMHIYWDSTPLVLEYHPGPAAGSIWAVIPDQKVAFVGDAVIVNQPPYLIGADIPAWLDTLKILTGKEYQNYLLVNGRNGLISHKHVSQQIDFLMSVQTCIDPLVAAKGNPEDTAAFVPDLLKWIEFPAERRQQYTNRLKYGLMHYFIRHYRSSGELLDE